jgi:DNA-binding MarR family transcriptional regulator
MNQIIAGMLKRGLIERSTSEDNRRILHMTLSPAGRETLKQGTAIAEQVEAEAMKWMAPEAHAQLRQQLTALLRQLRTNGPTPHPLPESDEIATSEDGADAHPDADKESVL